jgi:hypothetical protein
MQRCESGHYYDSEKYSTCPFCGVSDLEIGKTRSHHETSAPLSGVAGQPEEGSTHSPGRPQVQPNEDALTVGFFRKKTGIDQWWDGWYVSRDLIGVGITGFIRKKTLLAGPQA